MINIDPDRTEKEDRHALESIGYDEMFELITDRWWRLNNLYYIIDRFGKRVLFKPNTEQTDLYDNMWFQNIILKARQRGFTTFIDLFFLDTALFVDDTEAGIIAHNREDVSKIFRRKILYPYENLPDIIKDHRPTLTKSKTEIEFNNNSIISVGTSMRSGTLNLLHVSEFGKVCARFPEKAREIVTGSFEAIHTQTGEALLFVESTAEGRAGYFYDYCKTAQDRDISGQQPSKTEFKFHFFPWWDNTDNEQEDPVPLTQAMVDYFSGLEKLTGKTFSPVKRYWYASKAAKLGDDMKRENPSTPEEAFEQAVKGSYYAAEFKKIRAEKRITRIPIEPGIPVQVSWDLGISDYMCLWFFQVVGREIRWIDYYENEGEGLPFYFRLMQERGYFYGTQHLPHDARVRELRDGKTREEKYLTAGFKTQIAPGPQEITLIDGIDECRRILNMSWFDETRCALGIDRLEAYRKEWSDTQGCFKDSPAHDMSSHGADSFRTGALNIQFSTVPGAKASKRRRVSGMAA